MRPCRNCERQFTPNEGGLKLTRRPSTDAPPRHRPLTYLHAGHPRVVERLQALDDPDVGTTIITKIELLRGRFDFALKAATGVELLRAQALLARTEELLAQIIITPFNETAAAHFDRLRQTKGLGKLGRADLLIASMPLPIAPHWSPATCATSARYQS